MGSGRHDDGHANAQRRARSGSRWHGNPLYAWIIVLSVCDEWQCIAPVAPRQLIIDVYECRIRLVVELASSLKVANGFEDALTHFLDQHIFLVDASA